MATFPLCQFDWSAAAAWVQALGSIAAIFFAIKVGKDSDKRARELVDRERTRQGKIVAAIFALQFNRLAMEIHERILLAAPHDTELSRGNKPVNIRPLFTLRYDVPLIERRSEALLLEHDIGIAVAGVIDLLATFKTQSDLTISNWETNMPQEKRAEAYARLKSNIELLAKLSSQNQADLETHYSLKHPAATDVAT